MKEQRHDAARTLADEGARLYADQSKAGGAARIQWTDGKRVFKVVEPPAFAEAWPEFPQPALRMVLDVREDGKSVISPRANPFFYPDPPAELGDAKQPEAVLKKLVECAVMPSPAAKRER